jgi:acyl carrier protein
MVDKSNDAELYEQIRLVLKEVIPKGAQPDNISAQTRLLEDLNIDSIHAVDLVVSLEDTFGIRIEDGLIETLKTVGDVVALVRRKIA